MNAIFQIKNKQYNVKKNDVIKVDKMLGNINDIIKTDKVLFYNDIINNKIFFGKPFLKKINIIFKILKHYKDKKIIITKFKRRNNYKRIIGHRQSFTNIKIIDILNK